MWKRKTVAVVFPTTRVKSSILESLLEFDSTGYVDEIIVVDNNLSKSFKEEVSKTRAKYITERKSGHGSAIKTGLNSSKADIMIVAEPDGTFDGKDVSKLLSYAEDFDLVFGSRTHVSLIENGSEMTFARRLVNAIFGKFVTYLYLCPPVSDVGCVLRATNQKAWRKILANCKSDGNIFITEWLLSAAMQRVRYIDIPVNFRAKRDKAYMETNIISQAIWAIAILYYIIKIWLSSQVKKI